ncbi:MAG: hypothetical protein EXS55_04505 [Candidatus Magasanikbacteria bacterium]|nr:hypothetical protein [Candidatus Magasanikbacteria bacterium]
MPYFFKAFGVIGLLVITRGIFIKKEKPRDWYFAIGGIFLLAYSIYLRDWIFIILQLVFIASNLYREYQLHKHN